MEEANKIQPSIRSHIIPRLHFLLHIISVITLMGSKLHFILAEPKNLRGPKNTANI